MRINSIFSYGKLTTKTLNKFRIRRDASISYLKIVIFKTDSMPSVPSLLEHIPSCRAYKAQIFAKKFDAFK